MTNQQIIMFDDDFKKPIKAMSAGLSSAPHPSARDCSTTAAAAVISVGTKVCKRYDTGWYRGVVTLVPPKSTTSHQETFLVHFEDGEEETMEQDEVEAAALAYDVLYHHDNSPCRQQHATLEQQQPPRPPIGTRVKKRFGEEWYLGAVIEQTPKRSSVLYQDEGEEYMSDSELRVTAAVYQLHHQQPQLQFLHMQKQEPKLEYG